MIELLSSEIVKKVILGQQSIMVHKSCGICASMEHFIDYCPQLQESANPSMKSVVGNNNSTIPIQTYTFQGGENILI